jgi:peroxiredoxin
MFILNLKDKTRFSFHSISIFTIIVLIGFCSYLAADDSSQSSTNVSPANVRYKYQEIKELGKKPANQITSKELEKLVEKSTDFVSTFPEYKRVDEVYYYLGTSLVRLERVEEGIKVFEKSIMEHPETRFVPQCLLELGLAYDKLGKHDKGDETYKKLIDHSKFGSRSQAKQAKMILELDKAERNGELPQPAGAEPSSTPSKWVGKPAPGFQVKDLNGKELSLKKLHGQVVLLDFWATWCGPCIAEMPNVKKTYEKYKDQKFQIIGISLDRSIEPLKSFVKKEGLAWHQYFDNARILSTMYQVNAIPSTFLIDGEGIIRKTNLRGRSLETGVAELVKENLAIPAHTHPNTPEKGSQPQSIPATKLIKMKTDSQKDENLESRIANPSEWVGKPAPDFQVKNIKGEELSLKDFRGKVVFLDFWATWCGPCIAEMPKVKETYEKYKDQKFEIIGISLDRSQPPLDAYVEKEGLTWHHYWDENRKIRNLYEVKAIPTAFLIDGEGIIRKASLGGFDVETAVAALVKENLAKPADTPPTKTPADSPRNRSKLSP